MKTKQQNIQTNTKNTSELQSRPEQLGSEKQKTEKQDNRLPIDMDKRRANRCLGTQQVIDLLKKEAPDFFHMAQVVGKWVWIQFTDKQPRTVTADLAQLGFHWNNKRQVWQHPCGAFRKEPSVQDPRQKFESYFPADSQAA